MAQIAFRQTWRDSHKKISQRNRIAYCWSDIFTGNAQTFSWRYIIFSSVVDDQRGRKRREGKR